MHREVGDEGPDFGFSHFGRMAFVVKENEAADPTNIGLLSSQAKCFTRATVRT